MRIRREPANRAGPPLRAPEPIQRLVPTPPKTPASSRARRWLSLLVRVGGTGAAVWWVATKVDLRAAAGVLAGAPWWAFAVPMAVLGANALIQALRFRILFAAGDVDLRFAASLRVVLQALFIGQVVPRGGADVFRLLWLRRETGQTAVTVAAMLVARVFEITVLGGLLVYALAWGVGHRWPWVGASAALFAGSFLSVAALGALVSVYGERALAAIPVAAVRQHGKSFATAVATIGTDRRRLLHAALLTLPLSAGNLVSAWTVLHAYGVTLSLPDTLALVPAMDSVILLPVSVSGIGLREGVFVYVLGDLGVTEHTAVAMALCRWSAELARAAVGGVLFATGGRLRVRGSGPDAEEAP